jgi:hypothetical protein
MPGTDPADDTRVVRRPGVIAERLLDETVVLDPESDAYAKLNRTGGFLWERLDEAETLHGLAGALATRFDIPEERARVDTSAFVRDLVARGLVETGD